MSFTTSIFDGLTPPQRDAVDHFEGPLLVLAGPGSGKTRVITRRIARLVERGVQPRNILAITFTNKAAREMQERVDALLPSSRVWVSTFHRFCASLLRRRASLIGLESNFAIFDKSDQLQVVKQVLGDLDLDSVRISPAKIAARMSRIKNNLVDPESFKRSVDEQVGEPFDLVVSQVYPRYQEALLQSNAVDFDDLLLHMVRLMADNPELRDELDTRFRFVLVDEYQDTNAAQYAIVRMLAVNLPNLCVTGDPDQSIYGWRGAHIDNILNFERDFPAAKLIRLEHNFRSTKRILSSADRLIGHNRQRKAKSLITDNEEGCPVRLLRAPSSHQESDGIARVIKQACDQGSNRPSDFAIFYRVNSMSRELELALTRHHVPFQVAAGAAFYERAEIKDLLAYLRLIENPADGVAFARVVNKPARGLGAATISKLQKWAAMQRLSLFEAAREVAGTKSVKKAKKPKASLKSKIRRASDEDLESEANFDISFDPAEFDRPDAAETLTSEDLSQAISAAAKFKLKLFVGLIESFSLSKVGSVSGLLKAVVDKTFYSTLCLSGQTEQDFERRSNVAELISAAAQYDEIAGDERTLSGFLETTSLIADTDTIDPQAGKVTLMTLHAAKGLEFPTVFIVGLEHGLIPHERAIKSDDPKQLEEERRLLFVGMTRAMKALYLTTAQVRDERGTPRSTISSSFLRECDYESVEMTANGLVTRSDESQGSGSTDRLAELKKRLAQAPNRPLLTTGAALLSGSQEEASLPQCFAVGMQVRHPRYGIGTVVDVNGFSKRRTVTVHFADDRTESFAVAHCPLQPVGMR